MRTNSFHIFLITLVFAALQLPALAQINDVKGQAVGKAKEAAAVKNAEFKKAPADSAGIDFFERKIRPTLVKNCYQCHSLSAKKSLGNLLLDSRKGLITGGKLGTDLLPGSPETSRLIEAVRYAKTDLLMPPAGKMSEAEIADLVAWVKMGAPWSDEHLSGPASAIIDMNAIEKKKRAHWAWQPVRTVAVPPVKRKNWPKTPLDNFILAGLESKRLTPAPYADRRTLIRRAYFDLIGLPPTPEDVAAFLADRSPDAWPKLVDKLLASPHYGERWGRYWLDIARYGEDQAHSFEPRLYPQGFRYRDWVAHALNTDMPYDRFIKEQIAADLLNEPDKQDQIAALGFFALGPVYYGDGKMFDQFDDRIDTLSRGMLGLTVACARCHDHKFDPITQKDYYGLAGVFASTTYIEVPVASAGLQTASGKTGAVINRNDEIKKKSEELDKFAKEQTDRIKSGLTPQIAKYLTTTWKLHNRRKSAPKTASEIFASSEKVDPVVLERWVSYLHSKEGKEQPKLAAWRELLKQEDAKTDLSASEKPLAEARKAAEDFQSYILELMKRMSEVGKKGAVADKNIVPLDKSEELVLNEIVGPQGVLTMPNDKLDKFLMGDEKLHFGSLSAELNRLKMGSYVHALTDSLKQVNLPVLQRGNPDNPGSEEKHHFLAILSGGNASAFKGGSGRLELANAIADRNNPLTARVIVNRIWQHHFGVGLVRTTSNFGLLGEPPTNPALLDYMTGKFMENGWSIKSLHRQIMLSAAYQMTSAMDTRNYEIDPDNRLIWRMSRRRLDVEAWRDSMLAVSDKLDRTIGGPSVPLASPDNNRRTFYAAVSRHDLDPMLRLFDFPDPNATIDARMTTTVPLQQLFVLNSDFMIRQAKTFAARLTSIPNETDTSRIQRAFQLAFNRQPSSSELNLGLAFLQQSKPTIQAAGSTTLANSPAASPPRTEHLSRWEEYAQILLSANEFMYID